MNNNIVSHDDKTKSKIMAQHYYQNGYAAGYKRHKEHYSNDKEGYEAYFYNVLIVFLIFVILVVGLLYTYNDKLGKTSHYKGDCLIDLTSSYNTNNCLDN
jgi:cobalamin biosynthesis Mg chelatase CobN